MRLEILKTISKIIFALQLNLFKDLLALKEKMEPLTEEKHFNMTILDVLLQTIFIYFFKLIDWVQILIGENE